MAQATRKADITYTLVLNEDEATTLRTILDAVGGDPNKTPRVHSNAINHALRLAGADLLHWRQGLSSREGGLYFDL
jgi:hypothetical protein